MESYLFIYYSANIPSSQMTLFCVKVMKTNQHSIYSSVDKQNYSSVGEHRALLMTGRHLPLVSFTMGAAPGISSL